MRFSLPATAVCLCLAPFGLPSGVALAAPPGAVPATTVPAAAADGSAADAAARHAKRTACLKKARAKKLIGADKNTFIQDCISTH